MFVVRVHVDLEELGVAFDTTGVLVGLDSDGNVGMVHARGGSSGLFIVGHICESFRFSRRRKGG